MDYLIRIIASVRRVLSLRRLLRKTPKISAYEFNLNRLKRSDTLFILGSGDSINDITVDEWGIIKERDSVGFNYFIINDFIPNFYFYEVPANRDIYNLFIDILDSKKEYYRKMPIFINYDHFLNAPSDSRCISEVSEEYYFNAPWLMPIASRFLVRLYLYTAKLAILWKIWGLKTILHHSGSLSDLLFISAILGYKKVVLMGVDLSGPGYFYDKYNDKYSIKLTSLRPLPVNANVHDTDNIIFTSNYHSVRISDFIDDFYKIIMIPNDMELFVGSRKSTLYPKYKIYDFINNN